MLRSSQASYFLVLTMLAAKRSPAETNLQLFVQYFPEQPDKKWSQDITGHTVDLKLILMRAETLASI